MKEIFVLTDVERLEERLERRLSRITKLEPITLENGFAGGGIVYALEVTETKNKKSNGEGVIVNRKQKDDCVYYKNRQYRCIE